MDQEQFKIAIDKACEAAKNYIDSIGKTKVKYVSPPYYCPTNNCYKVFARFEDDSLTITTFDKVIGVLAETTRSDAHRTTWKHLKNGAELKMVEDPVFGLGMRIPK